MNDIIYRGTEKCFHITPVRTLTTVLLLIQNLQYIALAVISSLKCLKFIAVIQAWTLWPFTGLSVSSVRVVKRAGHEWISPDSSCT